MCVAEETLRVTNQKVGQGIIGELSGVKEVSVGILNLIKTVLAAPQVASLTGVLQESGLAPALASTRLAAKTAPATARTLNQMRIDKTLRAYPGQDGRSPDRPPST